MEFIWAGTGLAGLSVFARLCMQGYRQTAKLLEETPVISAVPNDLPAMGMRFGYAVGQLKSTVPHQLSSGVSCAVHKVDTYSVELHRHVSRNEKTGKLQSRDEKVKQELGRGPRHVHGELYLETISPPGRFTFDPSLWSLLPLSMLDQQVLPSASVHVQVNVTDGLHDQVVASHMLVETTGVRQGERLVVVGDFSRTSKGVSVKASERVTFVGQLTPMQLREQFLSKSETAAWVSQLLLAGALVCMGTGTFRLSHRNKNSE